MCLDHGYHNQKPLSKTTYPGFHNQKPLSKTTDPGYHNQKPLNKTTDPGYHNQKPDFYPRDRESDGKVNDTTPSMPEMSMMTTLKL